MLKEAGFLALWQPDVFVGIALFGALYLAVTDGPLGRLFPGHQPVSWRKRAAFLGALAATYVVVGSPLDLLADQYLFSVHMFQHVVLTVVVAPLLLLGVADWMVRPLLSVAVFRFILRTFTKPVVAILLFNIVFSFGHFPSILEDSLHSERIHFFEHAAFVTTALFMWWPVLSPLPEIPRLSEPLQLLYLFIDGMAMTLAFALITFAGRPLYPTYAAAPRLFGMSVMEDQQLGGIVMHIGVGISYTFTLLTVFFEWASKEHPIDQELLDLERPAAGRMSVARRTTGLRVERPRS